jgi:hypothetical protein
MVVPMSGESVPEQSSSSLSRRRGRPVGRIKLDPDAVAKILAYIEAGAADYIAAEAAGINERTFRDYLRRGRGEHSTRSSTPLLARFANDVMEAKARARVAREIQAAEHNVPFWLTHMARSKPGREGWTDPVEVEQEGQLQPPYQPSLEEAAETLQVLLDAGVLSLQEGQEPPSASDQDVEATGG